MDALQEKILAASNLIALLLVFTTVLFDIRYSQIQADLHKSAPSGKKAIQRFRDELIQSLLWKSLPLFAINAVVFCLFLPLLREVLATTELNFWKFDFVLSAFVFITLAEFAFVVWAGYLSIKLVLRIWRISAMIRNEK